MSSQPAHDFTGTSPLPRQIIDWPGGKRYRERAGRTWPVRVVVALLLTLASSIFVRTVATLPRGDQQPKLMRRDYCKWDCGWYAAVAVRGYERQPKLDGTSSWHFLPMFPLASVPAIHVFHVEPLRATVLASKMFLFSAILAFLWMLGDEVSGFSEMVLAAMLVAFNPYLIYAHGGYSESLYFTLAACAFAALERDKFVLAGFWGGLLSATRIQGVVFTVAYAVRCLTELGLRRMISERRLTLLLGLLLCPIGLSVYMIYLWRLTGDALAPIHSFASWGLKSGNPFPTIAAGFHLGPWYTYFAITAIVGLVLSVVLAFLRKFDMAVFLAVCILLPASAELAGMPRFFWWQPPVLYAVFRFLKRYPQLRSLYFVFVGGVAASFTYLWILQSPWLT